MALARKNNSKGATTDQEPKSQIENENMNESETKSMAKTNVSAPVTTDNSGVFVTNKALVELAQDAEYGDFPSITANSGTHMLKAGSNTKVDIGKVLEFQAIFAQPTWKVSTGSSDDEAKDFFKVSYDGDICTDGTPVKEALQDAIEAGYARSKIAEGIDVYAFIRKCEADPDQEGEIRVIQLSPSSKRNWSPLEKKVRGRAALGLLKAEPIAEGVADTAVRFRSTAVPTSWKGKDFTVLEFDLA